MSEPIPPILLSHVKFTNDVIKAALAQFMEHCEMSGLEPKQTVSAMISLLLGTAAEIGCVVADHDAFMKACNAAYDAAELQRESK